MRRFIWLLALGALLPAAATASLFFRGGAPGSAITYTGPCDTITCAEAYSPARAMTSAYAGNLFTLIRASDSTTLDVGQANHVADLSGVYNFCKLTHCFYYKLYGHINGNTLIAVNTATMTNAYTVCSTAIACAPPFLIDPATNRPIIRTIHPTSFALVNDGTATGINAGANAISIWKYARNEGWTTCCGTPGLSHSFNEPNTLGSYFGQWNDFGNAANAFFSCSTNVAGCSGVSWESSDRDGADYSAAPVKQDVGGLITWDGSAATNTVKVYWNSATPIYSKSPPCPVINTAPCLFGVNTIDVGKHIHYGSGGDTSQMDTIIRDLVITNNALSGSNFTALSSDAATFYAASVPACKGPAGLDFAWSTIGENNVYNGTAYNAPLAYGLYQMRADYYGPIADLRDSAGTVNTYGPASSGCVIDTAAATFCAANAPCTVAKLYNQGTFSGAGIAAHDPNTDLAQATVAKQPSVTFNALNGKPVMHFSGSQFLSSANMTGGTAVTILALVGRRTGAFTSVAQGITASPSQNTLLGWNNATDTAVTFSPTVTATASDSHYHSLVVETANTTSAETFYVDGVSGGTGSTGSWSIGAGHPVCLGAACDGTTQPFTGDIAEAEMMVNFAPGSVANQGYGFASEQAAVFSAHQTAWGALPN